MALTFADTHNMITFLTNSDASEGFEQIINFLNAHVIKYALMVNPTIYVSCIKHFWTSVSIKKSNDVVRLQALIDRKTVIITEDSIRQALQLDDADSVDFLPNEEIFVELARMGYEKPSTKLTFYKEFFSAQWKFLIHIILQCMSAKRTAWNEFSSSIALYTSPALTQTIFANMRRVRKGFSGVDTPLFAGMLVSQQAQDVEDAAEYEDDVHDADVLGRLEESQAKVYHLDLEHANKVLSMQETYKAEPDEVEEVIEVVTAAKLMTEAVTTIAPTITTAPVPKASTPKRRRDVIIQDFEEAATASDEAFARELEAELNANINWNDVVDQVKRNERQDNTVMRYQALKRKPLTKAQARKNIMHYNLNQSFLERVEEEVTCQEEEVSKRKSKSSEQRATKKQRIDEEVKELKTHLQIVPNDEDDVYTKATPLSLKPNVEASIWRDQKGRYGLAKVNSWNLFESCEVYIITFTTTQMILLVERNYPLTRFTLEQMLNNVRLEVEEESEISLELQRLMRRHEQEGYKPE
uniref:Xylulose kinase-1 n=1 Tax=Tanacetum cinerariifolium TaxID=118510 RepID=A0A699IKG5_TANCI|nr:hypothetical protein [Tanacetum cinerariifolium]